MSAPLDYAGPIARHPRSLGRALNICAVATLLVPVLVTPLLLLAQARFNASIPPGRDADDVGGDPGNIPLLFAAWILLIPISFLFALVAWWRGDAKGAGWICLVDLLIGVGGLFAASRS